ncbi:MAG: O-antigen ligase family protein [Candidatus Daviesbacteria bacterium]|nr:O-antigen ligase family protein [Candidatus Daviesbacteria bacterium]
MLDRIITYSFYLLFFLTPLFWSSANYELFEYNKMILVYGFTVIIMGAWLLKTINEKRLTIKRTPLDIPLLLFLGANILSTTFSIDPHTSIWGYYSRSNGGLLSIVSYLLLYFAFVSNMDWPKVKTALKFGLASGFVISLWAILEHFGVSPSCVILRGEFNDSCWIQDVQARVFASLGQPNWLAAYLSMLIFPALYFLLTTKDTKEHTMYYASLIAMYLAFTFTYSRGPTLGLIGGIVVFLTLYVQSFWRPKADRISKMLSLRSSMTDNICPKVVLLVLTSFLIINILFGSALTSFRLVSKFAAPARPGIALPITPSGTQLENGGTESGQIRFIVWKGALDIFKHYPLFGSGVETFAYSYYQYRPVEHNLTSEWDFLYNKAHNEYLNYLATTGIVGFGTYMLVIGTFIWWSVKTARIVILSEAKNLKIKSRDPSSKTPQDDRIILISALLASYISYLIYNFFLFSVVIIAVFFYLFPALAFVVTDSLSIFHFPRSSDRKLRLSSKFHLLISIIYRRKIYTKIAQGLVIFSIIFLLYSIFQLWYADTLFAKGERASDAGSPGRAYNLLTVASDLNKGEPFYRSELGFAAAEAAASLSESDATLSAALKDEAALQTEKVLQEHPKNVSFYRTAVRAYFELATIDKQSLKAPLENEFSSSAYKTYLTKTLQTLDEAINLAPTDPKLFYNKALILDSMGRKDEELQVLQQAIKLKPNYLEALAQLKEATAATK